MTLASVLFGGGGGAPFRSGNFYPTCQLNDADGATITADRDYLSPLWVRKPVTISHVAFGRVGTTAGNVYVGIYNSAGTLLTDCAVDADTSVGLHTVSTTAVTLLPTQQYWFCANASAAVVHGDLVGNADVQASLSLQETGFAIGMGASGYYTSSTSIKYGLYKARTNAALLSSLTMTGWTDDNFITHGGFVVA